MKSKQKQTKASKSEGQQAKLGKSMQNSKSTESKQKQTKAKKLKQNHANASR